MPSVEELSITTIRTLAMDAVQKANSGHPGTAMALAPVAYLLYEELMRHDPGDPHWPNRDRFVLSAGHACILQYAALHLAGYGLSIDDLKAFRQWGRRRRATRRCTTRRASRRPPARSARASATRSGWRSPSGCWRRATTGPGHEIVDHRTYCICSDGDLQEGVSGEASSIAGHLGLGRLTCFYDDNHISIEGDTALSFTEDVAERYRGYGWHVLRFDDTWTLDTLRGAVAEAHADPRPSMIILRTHIAPGAPNKQDTASAHGEPLGVDEIRLTKRAYGWPEDAEFLVPDEVARALRPARAGQGAVDRLARSAFDGLPRRAPRPRQPSSSARRPARCPTTGPTHCPTFTPDDGAMATRAAGGKVLQALAERRARAGRRLGRPGALDQHPDEGVRQRRAPATTAAATSTGASASTAWARS